jgi:hypothetical protein
VSWTSERDMLGWELDDVLEGYDVDYTVDTCALDPEISEQLDRVDAEQRDRDVFDAFDRYANRSSITGETIKALCALGVGT